MDVGEIKLSIGEVFRFYGIKGLEGSGLSDEEILKNTSGGGLAWAISRLKEAGWSIDRINNAQEELHYSWGYQSILEIYEKSGATSFEGQIDGLEALVRDAEELNGYLEELRAKIITPPESLSAIKAVVDNTYQQVHLILGQNYLQLAKIAKDRGMTGMAEGLTGNARIMFMGNSPPKELIKELYSLEAAL